MPELPEVEVIVQQIRPVLLGKNVEATRIIFPKLRYPIELPVVGSTILEIFRRNKYIILKCQFFESLNIFYAIWHLGMSGQFRYFENERPLEKHEHAELILNKGALRYYDPRRFGAMLLSLDWQKHPLLKDLGLEPLEHSPQKLAAHWLSSAQAQKNAKSIKPFLMNGKYVVGIGNIYASEILFQAKIHPQSHVQKLNINDWKKIAQHTQTILKQAIEKGGSTLHDFVDINGQIGRFQQMHFVYARLDLPCLRCLKKNSSELSIQQNIKKIIQEQRSSFFCPACQILKN